jgi:hypothetical protein
MIFSLRKKTCSNLDVAYSYPINTQITVNGWMGGNLGEKELQGMIGVSYDLGNQV